MKTLLLLVVLLPTPCNFSLAAQADSSERKLSIDARRDRLVIRFGKSEIAHYVFRDSAISRPYFAHVKTPGGTQTTRNHPPVDGKDSTDHATMHPGIWLAFGDLGGEDFWRNNATVEHVKFVEAPRGGDSSACFVEEKRYVTADGQEVCRELFRWKLHALDGGFLMEWNSTFTSDREFYFGDQEEMGLGVRVATPLAEKFGGTLRDSEGRKKAKQIWSQPARWCDYRGTIGARTVGMTVLCHPGNFRPSWMHARSYGLVVANPFGRKAMKKGDTSKVVVKPGESLRLRYGIWIYEAQPETDIDIEAIYRKYLKLHDLADGEAFNDLQQKDSQNGSPHLMTAADEGESLALLVGTLQSHDNPSIRAALLKGMIRRLEGRRSVSPAGRQRFAVPKNLDATRRQKESGFARGQK